MEIYPLVNKKEILRQVRKLDWKRDIPGGWLKYGPPREVCGYGDGSLYTDKGEKYGPSYKETAWAGAIPLNKSTLVVKTDPLPPGLVKTGLIKQLRKCLKSYGAEVDDASCTGMWCNYYNRPTDAISPHKDDENYYERNCGDSPLFVSLTLYDDEDDSLENLARFQIKPENRWETVDLPHASLLVMSGDIEHRVIRPKKGKFRKRYNITFRTPVKRKDDLIKNYRFFSNFGRYYKVPYKLYLPKNYDEKYLEIVESFSHLVNLEIKSNLDLTRNEILKLLGVKTRPPSTTTTMALYTLYLEK